MHGSGQDFDNRRGLRRRLRLTGGALGEAAAADVFQRKIRPALGFTDFVDLHDVWMLQRRDGLRLGAESSQRIRIAQFVGVNHLQGDESVEPNLSGLEDDAHSAPPQLAENVVPRHGRDGLLRRGRRREFNIERGGALDRTLAGAQNEFVPPQANGRSVGLGRLTIRGWRRAVQGDRMARGTSYGASGLIKVYVISAP